MAWLWTLFALATVTAGCCDDCDLPGEPNSECCEDLERTETRWVQELDDRFTRYGNGWTGGPVGHSVELPDGSVAWLCGESFVDTVFADGSRSARAKVVANSIVLTTDESFETIVGTGEDGPTPLLVPEEESEFYAPLSARVEGQTLEVLCAAYEASADSPFGIRPVRTDLVVLSLDQWSTLSRTTAVDRPRPIYGSALFEWEGQTYIFGTSDNLGFVARSTLPSLASPWEFYDGESWSASFADATPFVGGVSGQFSVFEAHGTFYLLSMEPYPGTRIILSTSPSVVGPWTPHRLVWDTQSGSDARFFLNAKVHSALSTDLFLVLSLDLSSSRRADFYDNFRSYRPYFLRAADWQ